MVIVGFLSYFGYFILGLNYAVPLAIVAGILEVIPNIGPTVAAVIAAFVGLTVSPLTAILAIIWGTIVQQLENNFIVPKVMKETIGINPLITLLVLAAGTKIGGITGTLLSIPTYLFIETSLKVLNEEKDKLTK
jgi:predicted PurR-regulated permease PerM